MAGPCTRGPSPIPELPEVETVRRELEPWLTHRIILSATRVDAPPGPKYADLGLAVGRRIAAVERRGKFLLLPLEDATQERATPLGSTQSATTQLDATQLDTTQLDATELPGIARPRNVLVIHLGMTGVIRPDPPEKHVRVRLDLDPGRDPVLYFEDPRRFGRFLVSEDGVWENLPTLAQMGPEPLSEAFTVEGFRDALKRSSVAVKTYLLSQKPVAGVGNIYADEALWRARVHPLTSSAKLSKPKTQALHGAIRDVLEAAVAQQGTTLRDYRTVNGNIGAYAEQLDVYGHPDEPCPRCGSALRKIVVGGRGTHFCARCQPRR